MSASPERLSKRWRADCELAEGERADSTDGALRAISEAAARVYAKALFNIAADSHTADQVSEELHGVSSAIGGLDPQLRGFFEMPQIRKADKQQVVNLAFEGKVSRPVLGLLHVLVEKRREALLNTIVTEYDELVDDSVGRVRANVISARPLDTDLADAIRTALEQRTQRRVGLRQRVDPAVLGGIRVSLGDLVIDGTLRRGLLNMRRALAAAQQ